MKAPTQHLSLTLKRVSQRPPSRIVLLFLVSICFGSGVRAGVTADASVYFPAKTGYLEYDNLAALRKLPSYNALRQSFSGKPLEDAKAVLVQLGIGEDEIHEIVVGSHDGIYYGLLAGTFSAEAVQKSPEARRLATKLVEHQEMYCAKREICVYFLQGGLAAFGPVGPLKEIALARDGHGTGMGASRHLAAIMQDTGRDAPVRGAVFGKELQTSIASVLGDWGSWKPEQDRLASNLSGIAYGVSFDNEARPRAHVVATLECSSATSATLVSHILSSLNTLRSVTGPGAGLPFRNVTVSASGNLIHFQGDTPIPTPGR